MRHGGFTLIELMIVCVIAAILASIAIPSYQAQVRKSRRTDARTALLDLAGREERFLSVNNSYSQTPSDLGYSGTFPQNVGSNYYSVNVTTPDPAATGTAPSFIITATAINTQASDSDCLTLSVNQVGQQTSTGTGTAATCWGN